MAARFLLSEGSSRLALVSRHQGLKLTSSELLEKACGVAAALKQLGYGPGSRLAVLLPNVAENVVAQLACAQSGVHYVSAKTAKDTEALFQGDSIPTGLLTDGDGLMGIENVDVMTKVHPPMIVGADRSQTVPFGELRLWKMFAHALMSYDSNSHQRMH